MTEEGRDCFVVGLRPPPRPAPFLKGGGASNDRKTTEKPMNISIPHSWLLEYLKTKKSPQEIGEALSLCGFNVERIKKIKDEPVYQIEVPTNRPDAMSVIGIARELRAALGLVFHFRPVMAAVTPLMARVEILAKKELPLDLKVETSHLLRMIGVILDEIEVKPSPFWIERRLIQAGLRPLNNIIDITNYVLIEYGQPLHAFDYDEILGAKMRVRCSKKGEKLVTLDGKQHEFGQPPALIIEDKERLIDLLGIMGGKNSRVTAKTKRIFLQAPIPHPVLIRQASRALGQETEASALFEKGLSCESAKPALLRAIELVQDLARGKVASRIIDWYPKPERPERLKLNLEKVERIVGIKIPRNKIIHILKSLGFEMREAKSEKLKARGEIRVRVPYWRSRDIQIEEDIIEEIVRIYGYHRIPCRMLSGEIPVGETLCGRPDVGATFANGREDEPLFRLEDKIKNILKGAGLTEVYTYSFISEELLRKMDTSPKKCPKVANPLSEEFEYMRPSLLMGLLEVVAKNQKIKKEIKIFELSKVYLSQRWVGGDNCPHLPREEMRLTGLVAGREGIGQLFYQTKGVVELLLEEIGIPTSYALKAISIISQDIRNRFDIRCPVAAFDFKLPDLIKKPLLVKTLKPLPIYPSVKRDFAFVLDKKITYEKFVQEMQAASPLITEIELFDVYEGHQIPSGKKSLAFHISFSSAKRTLKTEEVEKVEKKLLETLKEKFGAEIRK